MMSLEEKINDEEKQFLENIAEMAEKAYGDRKVKVLETGLTIHQDTIEDKLNLLLDEEIEIDEETIKSLEEKNIVERFSETQEKHHTLWETKTKENENSEKIRKREAKGKIRKKVDQEYLKINKKHIDKIFEL